MTIRGQRLFVNVSAAEARRRLAGRGLGVRRIHSGGRNHTAEGQHLDELQAIFRDVGCSQSELELSEPVQNLRNLGETSATWLRDAGILTVADLRRVGAVAAFQKVRQQRSNCSWNLLWAIAAGLEGRDWRELSLAERQLLQQAVET